MENFISRNFASKFDGCSLDGTKWLIKCVDPASSKEIYPTPDSTNQDRVALEVRTTMDIPITGATNTWDCRIGLTPHPLFLGFARVFAGGGTSVLMTYQICNPLLDWSVALDTPVRQFTEMCEKSRCLYSSVTANLVCTDLTNQGSVYCVQYERPYQEFTALYGGPSTIMRPLRVYDTDDNLTSDQMTTFKSAYVGSAKDGLYSVLKLSDHALKWVSSEDTIQTAYSHDIAPALPSRPEASLDALTNEPYPYQCTHYTAGALVLGYAIQRPYDDTISSIVFKGIDKAATLRLTYRMGLELVVRPNTTYAPLLICPTTIDSRAMLIRREVLSMIADGYPAAYNDLGSFLTVVKKLAGFANRNIFPLVESLVPGGKVITNTISQFAKPIGNMIDKKLNSISANKKAASAAKPPSNK